MIATHRRLTLIVGAGGMLAVSGWLAGAIAATTGTSSVQPGALTPGLVAIANGPNGGGGCDDGQSLQGTAGTINKTCQGSGLSFIGPSIGQLASMMGPTVIGPAIVTGVNEAAGSIGVAAAS